MNNFFSNKKLIIIFISVVLFGGLLAFSLGNSGNTNFASQMVNDVTAVFSRVLARPTAAVNQTFENIKLLSDTFEENKRLKEEAKNQLQTQAELNILEQENQALKDQLALEDSITDYSTITGNVIARNPDSWMDQLVIDLGSNDGVELDMAVMGDQGMVGRISEVSPTSSKVRLLTTNERNTSLVSAQVLVDEDEEAVHGVISDYDEETGRLILSQITSEGEIEEGQQVVTSGLSGITPSSLLIGTVDEVTLDNFGLTSLVYVEPATDMEDVRFVTVVRRTSEGGG